LGTDIYRRLRIPYCFVFAVNAKITGTAEVAWLLRQQNGVPLLLFPSEF